MPPRTLEELLTDEETVSDSWERMRALREARLPSPMEEQQAIIEDDVALWNQMRANAMRLQAQPVLASRPIPEGAVVFTGFDENGNVQTRPVTPADSTGFINDGRLISRGSHVNMTTTATPSTDFTFSGTTVAHPYASYDRGGSTLISNDWATLIGTPEREPNYTNIVQQRGRNGRNSDGQITYINTWGGQSPKKGLRNIPMFNDLLIDGSNRTKVNSKVRVTYARVDDVVLDLLIKQLKIDETTPVQTEFAF